MRRAADRLPRRGPVGRDTGVLARRRRRDRAMLVVLLVTANLVVWVVAPQWEARVAALVLTVLLAPMLLSLLARRH